MKYVPIKQEVEDCHRRIIDAGGMLMAGKDCPIEEDYFFETIRKAAEEIVIEGVRYWQAKLSPDLEGCRDEDEPKTFTGPWWSYEFESFEFE